MSDTASTPAPPAGPSGSQPSGRPGGYQRSASGLVGAMIILVLVVLVFIGFRGTVRDNPDSPPLQAVAYGQVVRPAAEQTGWPVAAPSNLPTGWVATSVRWNSAPGAYWHLGLLTDDQQYVGIEQTVSTTAAAVEEYVGEDAQSDGDVSLPAPPTAGSSSTTQDVTWQRWVGADGDVALTTQVGEETLLVVTSGTQEQLRSVVDSLQLQG